MSQKPIQSKLLRRQTNFTCQTRLPTTFYEKFATAALFLFWIFFLNRDSRRNLMKNSSTTDQYANCLRSY